MITLDELMNQVRGGKEIFKPQGDSEEDKREFQCIVRLLQNAYHRGALSAFEPIPDSDDGNGWVILVDVKL